MLVEIIMSAALQVTATIRGETLAIQSLMSSDHYHNAVGYTRDLFKKSRDYLTITLNQSSYEFKSSIYRLGGVR
ncbi:hypothetical protein Plhal304r1_c032g0102201 [Plasmopara halstedii]